MLRLASRRLASLSSSPWRPNHSAALSATVTKSPVTGVDASSEKESRTSSFSYSSPFPSQFLLPSRGPNCAFGELIAASGITDAMLDSLIALKDLDGVEGLLPLREIEDMRYEKNTRKSARAEIERLKQEEVAKARVREVDEKGRACGTGRRKCSIARVWIQPGNGNFVVNDKEFDVYFPMLDHRAALLRPFSETKTLGTWDISCTVKGGGFSGQVGAIQLGISRALQNWVPELRPPLKVDRELVQSVSCNLPVQSVSVAGNLVFLAATADHFLPALPRPLIFEPISRIWEFGPPLTTPQRWCAAGASKGVVYVASGIGCQFNTDVARSVEKWDLKNNRRGGYEFNCSNLGWNWEKLGVLIDGRFSREPIDAVGLRGKLYMVNVKGMRRLCSCR